MSDKTLESLWHLISCMSERILDGLYYLIEGHMGKKCHWEPSTTLYG